MEWLLNNWAMVCGSALLAVVLAVGGYRFWALPQAGKIAKLKEWLLWAVSKAETELGSGTGVLKLRLVYDMAVERFPWVERLVDFEVFCGWVDEALDRLREEIARNPEVAAYVGDVDHARL